MSQAARASQEVTVLFELTGVGVVQTDLQTGRFRRANRTFCELLGYTEAELQGLTYRDITHPDDVKRDAESFRALQRGEQTTSNALTRCLRKDGEVVWLELHVTVFGEGDEALNLTVVNDVTARQQAEQELRRTNRLLRATFDGSLNIIQLFKAVRDERGAITDFEWLLTNERWNERWVEMAGKRLLTENPAVLETGLFDTFKQVTESGVPVTHEHHYAYEQFDGWFFQTIVQVEDGFLLSTLDITERKEAEAALRASEEKYRTLFESMDEGFCVAEVVRDAAGQPVDLLYLELNGALERQTGLSRDRLLGRRLSEVLPPAEAERWAALYGRLTDAGEPTSTEEFVEQLERWYEVSAYHRGGDRVSVFYRDITERKQAEERQAFLLKLSDALRPLADPVDIQETVTRTAMHHFGADRCYYCEIEGDDAIIRRDAARDDLPSVAGVYPLGRFALLKAAVDAGRLFVVEDVRTTEVVDEALRRLCLELQVISFVDVPIIKNGEPVGVFCLVQSAPRRWTELEMALAVETAERTWAAVERAHAEEALRASEEKYRTLFETVDEGFCVMELVFGERGGVADIIYREANAAFEQHVGFRAVGKRASEVFPHIEQQWLDAMARVHHTGVPERTEGYNADSGRWFTLQYSRVGDEGNPFVAAVFNDITERKRRGRQQEYLLELADTLRPLADPLAVEQEALRVLRTNLNAPRSLYAEALDQEGTMRITAESLEPGLPPMQGLVVRFADFTPGALADALAGRPLWREDVSRGDHTPEQQAAYTALGTHAWAMTPLVKKGRLVAVLAVHASEPRAWTPDEIELIQETTDRTWAAVERARAEAALRDLNETLEQQVAARTEELRRSQMRFIQAFHAGPVATCITTLDQDARTESFLEVNEAFTQLTGYPAEEAVGRTAHDLGMWASAGDQQRIAAAFRESGHFRNLELQVTTKEGDVRDVLLSAEVIRLDGHEGFLKLFYDVTEQKRSEEQLYRAIQEVMSNTAWFSRQVLERLAQIRSGNPEAKPSVELTQRERQVLGLLAQGKSNEAIAAELGLATQTVRNYISVVYDKLGVHSRAEAVVWARERGISYA